MELFNSNHKATFKYFLFLDNDKIGLYKSNTSIKIISINEFENLLLLSTNSFLKASIDYEQESISVNNPGGAVKIAVKDATSSKNIYMRILYYYMPYRFRDELISIYAIPGVDRGRVSLTDLRGIYPLSIFQKQFKKKLSYNVYEDIDMIKAVFIQMISDNEIYYTHKAVIRFSSIFSSMDIETIEGGKTIRALFGIIERGRSHEQIYCSIEQDLPKVLEEIKFAIASHPDYKQFNGKIKLKILRLLSSNELYAEYKILKRK